MNINMNKCSICKKSQVLFIQRHHLFSQTNVNKRLYPDFIHDNRNILIVCADCHLTKTIPKYTEKEFCKVMGITPRSKTERFKNENH